MTSQELHATQDDFHGDVRWCLKDEAPTVVLSRAVQQEVAKIWMVWGGRPSHEKIVKVASMKKT